MFWFPWSTLMYIYGIYGVCSCVFSWNILASIWAARRLFAAVIAWMSPVRWRLNSSMGITCHAGVYILSRKITRKYLTLIYLYKKNILNLNLNLLYNSFPDFSDFKVQKCLLVLTFYKDPPPTPSHKDGGNCPNIFLYLWVAAPSRSALYPESGPLARLPDTGEHNLPQLRPDGLRLSPWKNVFCSFLLFGFFLLLFKCFMARGGEFSLSNQNVLLEFVKKKKKKDELHTSKT